MSHFTVNVCLPPTAAHNWREAVGAAMRPFDKNLTTDYNPRGEWDRWYLVSDERGFVARPGHDGDPRLLHEAPPPPGQRGDHLPQRCAGGPRGLLDLEATKACATDRARARWQARQRDFERLVADHPPAQPLTAFLRRHESDPDAYPRARAVAEHHAQPLVRALNHRSVLTRYPSLGVWVLGPDSDPISHFTRDPRADLDFAAAEALAAMSLLTLDGRWVEPGRPTMSDDSLPGPPALPGEKPSAAYARRAAAYLEELDDDCFVVRLHCHS